MLILCVFNVNGNDLECLEVILVVGQIVLVQWLMVLVCKVKGCGQYVCIGVMKNGVIMLVVFVIENCVYLKLGNCFELEIWILGLVDLVDLLGGDFDFVYLVGFGSYMLGEIVVKGIDGKLYVCCLFLDGVWCNINVDVYCVGIGFVWCDVWIVC